LAVKYDVGTNQNISKCLMNNSRLEGFLRQLTVGWWMESTVACTSVDYRW